MKCKMSYSEMINLVHKLEIKSRIEVISLLVDRYGSINRVDLENVNKLYSDFILEA